MRWILPILLILGSVQMQGCVTTAVVGTTAASAAFDERTVGRHADDVAIATKVDAKLIAEKDLPARWVSVEVVDGVVYLTGFLPSREHIRRAVYLASQVKGVRQVNADNLKVGEPSMLATVSDSWITTKIKSKLLADPVVSGFTIHVETVNGKVYLTGIVGNRSHRQRAIDIARATAGVTAVVDLMQDRQH
ncbi:MAG: BON domain-containing protein [Zetaproteobacteria bacterium]|nr:MAG: BON domain-containing protein [Zetaproteobacteria bacterium]